MSRIAIDCRFGAVHGGLGTYVRGLVPALVAEAGSSVQWFLLVKDTHEEWLSPLHAYPSVEIVAAPFPHYSWREHLALPRILRRHRIDLLYVPHFNAPLFSSVPVVVTVHDMILHRYPNQTSLLRRLAYRFVFSQSIARARSIITISDATKRDLLGSFPIAERKSTTVYPGISDIFQPSPEDTVAFTLTKYAIESPYFLYIGNSKEHKNVQFLCDAFHKAALPGFSLILLTGGKEAANLRLPDRVHRISDVSDPDLPHLLSGAWALVTASTMEGFCLPVVEAMACGCPVFAPDIEPFPEVTRGHVVLGPLEERSFVEALRRMASDPRVRLPERLLAAREFAQTYTWKNAAARVLEMLR